jgi:hypothetical protein
MNTVAREHPAWSRRRWVYATLAILAVHAALAFQFSRPAARPAERPLFRTAIQLATSSHTENQVAALAEQADPTLLALPTPRGFSGPAWLEFEALDVEAVESLEPAYWLGLSEQLLGSGFTAFLRTNTAQPALIADRALPRLPRFEPTLSSEPLLVRSRLMVEGDLARRVWLETPLLPAWPSSEALSNSVVQTVVNRDGVALFTVLLGQSGSREADAWALECVRQGRFKPLPADPQIPPAKSLSWGRLTFRWQTLPQPITNNPPLLQ